VHVRAKCYQPKHSGSLVIVFRKKTTQMKTTLSSLLQTVINQSIDQSFIRPKTHITRKKLQFNITLTKRSRY